MSTGKMIVDPMVYATDDQLDVTVSHIVITRAGM
jgi:hypothetical protein